ncbi:MAG: DUF4382 domain-containing protein [Salinivenus sp.]
MRRLSTILLSSVVAFGLVAMVGCDSSSVENGTMNVQMTDASGTSMTSSVSTSSHVADDLDAALVTITEISVTPAENGETDSDDERVVLSQENFDVDLVDLNAGIDTTITDLDLPAGEYGQIRLATTGDVAITFSNGDENTAMIASEELKLNFDDPITVNSADDLVDVTVDWNVENSLEGNLGAAQLVITPVVDASATVTSVDDASQN